MAPTADLAEDDVGEGQAESVWTGKSNHMQEIGVAVVDEWRHFVALLLVTRMNGPHHHENKGEGEIGVYEILYGK